MIAGLMLNKQERKYGKVLRFVDKRTPRPDGYFACFTETEAGRSFRVRWAKPNKPIYLSTSKDFVRFEKEAPQFFVEVESISPARLDEIYAHDIADKLSKENEVAAQLLADEEYRKGEVNRLAKEAEATLFAEKEKARIENERLATQEIEKLNSHNKALLAIESELNKEKSIKHSVLINVA